MSFAKIIATCLGIGYIQKGAGTVAALFCCLLWYLLGGANGSIWLQLALLIIVFFTGVLAGNLVEKDWGKDSNKVVIDEAHGILVALFLLPSQWQFVLAALVLFRFFDIAKPLGIRKMERFAGGWGVMADDLLAGIYSNVILQLAIKSHLFS